MKIAFSGSQCTGKTTLVEHLQTLDRFQDFEFFTSMTRKVNNSGRKINLDGDDDTQLLILSQHIDRLLGTPSANVIYDRCIGDGYVYTKVLQDYGQVWASTTDIARQLCNRFLSYYDCIFYIPPEIPLQADGQRSVDEMFRDRVVAEFDKLYSNAPNVYTITGSTIDRTIQVLDTLDQLK